MKNMTELKNEMNERELSRIGDQLDTLQDRLPTAPANMIRLNRAIASSALSSAERLGGRVAESVEQVSSTAGAGVKTVVGTAKWVARNTASVATTGARTVTGQLRAQSQRTVDTVNDEVVDLTDSAIDRVESSEQEAEKRQYRSMTKSELYELAQDRDVDGRSAMSKSELVAALTALD